MPDQYAVAPVIVPMEDFETKQATQEDVKCPNCGATLKFKPGTESLACEYCGADVPIPKSAEVVAEIDYEKFITQQLGKEDKLDIVTVKCTACGAATTLRPNVTSDLCPFCGTALIVKEGSTSTVLKPKSLLPFKVDREEAFGHFKKWIHSRWFAPNDLKRYADTSEKLSGMYVPYWTFDANTYSFYTGERGDYYWVTVPYTTYVRGRPVLTTRQVRKIRWTPVSGRVSNSFDDILVLATHSLPRRYADALEPWDLQNLVPFDDKFLSGFRTESYQIELKQGFEIARGVMDEHIYRSVRRAIGGDEQRVHSIRTRYEDVTFKHILLPVWLSAYRFRNKVYRFMVNARTGEVQGERPYSWIKITLFVLMILAIIVVVGLAAQHFGG